MCTSFIAKNFRAFKEIKIHKLARVNLFLGENSVGKTALLEALYIYLHGNKTEAIAKLLLKKEEHLSSKEDLASVIKHLFHGHSLPKPNELGIVLSTLKTDKQINKTKSVTLTTDVKDKFDELLMIGQGSKKREYPLSMDFEDFCRHFSIFGDDENNKQENLKFVYGMGSNSSDVAKLWDSIAFEPKQNEVIKALQIIEPELTDVAFIEVRHPRDRTAIAKISDEKVPFKSMGDGINRILHIVLNMVNAQNGYLLIDEFENGLHYLVQKQLWKVIFTLSETLNVQVFATTHSSDCIQSFGSQWQQNDKDFATLHRIDYYQNKHTVMPYEFEELSNALTTQTEVR